VNWRHVLARLVSHLPIFVPGGPLRGFWWTAFPWSAYWRGTFEPRITRHMQSLLPGPGCVAWDIGAHFGYYALQMARNVGPAGQVLAVEANPASFERLQQHQRWNRLTQLRCACVAASDQAGRQVLLNYADPTATTAHLAYPEEDTTAAPSQLEIPTAPLDDLVDTLNLRLPDLVKIDVEGHGAAVVRGMQRTLARKRPVLFIAMHGHAELSGIRLALEPFGYAATLSDHGPLSEPWPEEGDYLFVPSQPAPP
jgi:FkbM family methyltransferase